MDSEPLRFEVYREVLAELDAELTREVYAREWVAAGRGPEYAVEHWSLPLSADELRARRKPRVLEALRRSLRPMPGAREVLVRLAAEFPLALATHSGADEVAIALDRLDAGSLFAAVVGREDYERPKPAPDAFLEAARRLGVAPGDCVVIEDAERGVAAAADAGMPCVVVRHEFNRDASFAGASAVLESLDRLDAGRIRSLVGG